MESITLQLTEKAFLDKNFFTKRMIVFNEDQTSSIFNRDSMSEDMKIAFDALSTTIPSDSINIQIIDDSYRIVSKLGSTTSITEPNDISDCVLSQITNLINNIE